jgi:protein-tyrosine phosphatase
VGDSGTQTASRVRGNLWIGGAPGPRADTSRWDHVVLTAREYQPPASWLPGSHVLHVPLQDRDAPIPSSELRSAEAAASTVASWLRAGDSVLVTCWSGRNRSALVAGLALRELGVSGPETVRMLRDARGDHVLGNQWFVAALLRRR